MNRIIFISLFVALATVSNAQTTLSLDSCRALALRNNKQINIAKLKQDVADNTRKAARTKYLPHVDVLGGYEFMSKEISILNNEQKGFLGNLGTATSGQIGSGMSSAISDMLSKGAIDQKTADALNNLAGKVTTGIQQTGNNIGNSIKDAFRTDTRNIFTASVMLTQPIYMGGAIVAANKMAEISRELAANDLFNKRQSTVFDIDNAYWTVISLKHKQTLATSYLELVKKLSSDVHKMIKEGVATKADGLKVDVKVNEAEMQLTEVDNGLSLSKMLLCQLCGIPISKDIILEDESSETVAGDAATSVPDIASAMDNRVELKMLQNVVDLSKQNTKLTRSAYLPQIALTGGYLVTNPNLYNGYEKKFSGVWNVGVLVRVPVWNWFEGRYKIRASKAATSIALMELDDTKEKIELQINQNSYKVSEAEKRLALAKKSTEQADENLRCADLGFKEGVMDVTDVMSAQTAWLKARSQKIDSEIDLLLARTGLKKALGENLY